MFYQGIHHTAFATADAEATVHFWRDLLGMRLVLISGEPGNRQYFFEVGENSCISFFEWAGVDKIPYKRHGEPVNGPFVFDHIAIGVTDQDALWEVMALLDAGDFPASDVVDHGYCYSLYSYDPNGIPIEFTCNARLADGLPLLPAAIDPTLWEKVHGAEPVPYCWPLPDPILPEDRIIVPGAGKELYLTV
ncbi:MAG: VOC family protein [Magnetococcales bacterium]|nr:VOC family protein [Magnetococcales bacterium]